ncbi:DUF3267 domain-containing protein [Sunxiuqinia sp. A32]|uniref:DUF3267 domain-containing protein n=1 Tax=Sunxiuqinia sp. A32 TaxID=3461496 RepID=UPI00404674EE
MHQLTPEDIINNENFELIAEVEHVKIKAFIMEQVMKEKEVIRAYGIYQVSMMAIFLFILVKAIIAWTRAAAEPIGWIGLSVVFSLTALVVIHELIHALAYWTLGKRNLKVGAMWRKFIFYIAADRQVVDFSSFRKVALAPFVVVKMGCIVLAIYFWTTSLAYFFMSLMCIHSLFCAGDIAMLAFYHLHHDKEIYNFDDLKEGKTYFYSRKSSI